MASSTNEFTAGSVSYCTPFSLILPRHDSEEALLIGTSSIGKNAALILAGCHQFTWSRPTVRTGGSVWYFTGWQVALGSGSDKRVISNRKDLWGCPWSVLARKW